MNPSPSFSPYPHAHSPHTQYITTEQSQYSPETNCQRIDESEGSTMFSNRIREYQLRNYDMLDFQQLKRAIYDDSIDAIHYGIIGLRKLLRDQELQYTIDLYFNEQLIDKFIQYGNQNQYMELKKESFHILSSLSLGTKEHSEILIRMGMVSLFLSGLVSANHEIVELSLRGVDNLILENPKVRDSFIDSGIMPYLLENIQKRPSNSIANMSIITVCNMIRVKPIKIEMENIESMVAYFCWYMRQAPHQQRDESIIWAFTHLTHNNQDMLRLITNTGISSNLVSISKSCHTHLKYPTLKMIKLILAQSNPEAIQEIVNSRVIDVLEELAESEEENIRSQVYQIGGLLGNHRTTETLVYSNVIFMNKLWAKLVQKGESEQNFRSIGNVFMRPVVLNRGYDDRQRYTSASFYREMNVLKVLMEYMQVFKSSYCMIDCLGWVEMLLVAGKNHSGVGGWVENTQFLENYGDKIINDLERDTTNETIKKLIVNIRAVRENK